MLPQNASLSSTFHFRTPHPLYATFIHKNVIIFFMFEQKMVCLCQNNEYLDIVIPVFTLILVEIPKIKVSPAYTF